MPTLTPAKTLLTLLIGIGASLFMASYIINEQQRDIVAGLELAIVEQEKTLSNLVEITDRNGADAIGEAIIKDCTNRPRFESLLNELANLDQAGLNELSDLFDGCAPFFAERKALMLARLQREYEAYETLVNLLATVDDAITVSKYKLPDWKQLIEFEKRRSEIFSRQVGVQLDIIRARQAGAALDSERIRELLAEAANISEEAVVVNQQIDQLRAPLLDV